ETSTRNLLTAEAAEGVRHHVALSVVGTARLSGSGYIRAKIAQEKLIAESAIPYSIVHATQFYEFFKRIADDATDEDTVRLPPVLIQPIAADDVARALGEIAVGTPVKSTVEIAGPEQLRFDSFIRQGLRAIDDPRKVAVDPHARYFGAELSERTLVASDDARLGTTRFEAWLHQPGTPGRDVEPADCSSCAGWRLISSEGQQDVGRSRLIRSTREAIGDTIIHRLSGDPIPAKALDLLHSQSFRGTC